MKQGEVRKMKKKLQKESKRASEQALYAILFRPPRLSLVASFNF